MATMDGRIGQNLGGPCTSTRTSSPIWVSAGSRYSLVVLADGTTLSAGLIDWMNDYRGHLGLEEGEVKEGVNKFRPVSQVYDPASLSFFSVPKRIPVDGRVVDVAVGQIC